MRARVLKHYPLPHKGDFCECPATWVHKKYPSPFFEGEGREGVFC